MCVFQNQIWISREDPDPTGSGSGFWNPNPRIRIRKKLDRIRNTDGEYIQAFAESLDYADVKKYVSYTILKTLFSSYEL